MYGEAHLGTSKRTLVQWQVGTETNRILWRRYDLIGSGRSKWRIVSVVRNFLFPERSLSSRPADGVAHVVIQWRPEDGASCSQMQKYASVGSVLIRLHQFLYCMRLHNICLAIGSFSLYLCLFYCSLNYFFISVESFMISDVLCSYYEVLKQNK
jgi:hypothetical protein